MGVAARLGVAALLPVTCGCGGAPAVPAKPSGRVVTNSIGMRLVELPAGGFVMGSDGAERGDGPRHRVTITRPFWIGRHEVTQSQYRRVMGTNPSRFAPGGDLSETVRGIDTAEFPADRVSWEEATEFCRRLSTRPGERAAGRVYRLPTEAEWEYACRAGSQAAFSNGDTLDASRANVAAPAGESAPAGRPTTVGSYPPNAWGLHDLHGNVWEWCADGRRDYSRDAVSDPTGPVTVAPIVRGGAWDFPACYARSAARQPALRGYVFFGLRVACDVAAAEDQRASPTDR